MDKISIYLDTNVVKKLNGSLNEFEFNDCYTSLKKYVYGNSISNIKIKIPRIVIDELINQYIEEYRESTKAVFEGIEKVAGYTNRLGWDVRVDREDITLREYIQNIGSSAQKYIEQESDYFEVVDHPDSTRFSRIIDRAIRKQKPFFGGKSPKPFSDAGFKDVVFLESVLTSVEKDPSYFLVFSMDKIFKEISLDKEINGVNGEIIDQDNGKMIIDLLEKMTGIIDMSKHRLFCQNMYFVSTIEEILECKIVEQPKSIYKVEENGSVLVEVHLVINKKDKEDEIKVRLSEENDFLEILRVENSEVIYEWID